MSKVKNKSVKSKSVKSEPFEISVKKLTLKDYAIMIKNEYEFIYKNKFPTVIRFLNKGEKNEISTCIINETINSGYETQLFIMYSYKDLNQHCINEFDRIIYPINDYNILKEILLNMPELDFLSLFAEIKRVM